MRIMNPRTWNANPIFGAFQPEIGWGYSGGPQTVPDTTDFFTNKPLGSLYAYNRSQGTTYGTSELWQKSGVSNLASDWRMTGGCLTARISVADFTDGGSTAGTLDLTNTLPAGAFVLGSTVNDVVGWAGDTSAVLIIGTSGTTNQFCTSTFNVFATAAIPAGVTTQNTPSGARGATAAVTVRVTVTSATDFTLVKTNAAGRATVSIFYLL